MSEAKKYTTFNLYLSFLDITTTHSTWHEPLQAMFGFVLQFGGVRGVGGAYRGNMSAYRL